MGLDDRPGNRQPHAHAVRLGGDKRVEDLREPVGGDAGAGVVDADLDNRRARRAIASRGHADPPILPARAVEGVHAVENEIEQHLLNVHAIATDVRDIAGHGHVQLHVPRRRVDPQERRDLIHERADLEPPGVERAALEQGAHALDDPARPLVVGADVGENGADLVEIRRGLLQVHLRRLGVAQNRRERLIDLVRQPRREVAHHRDPPRVRDLLSQRQPFLLGLFGRRDVAGGAAQQHRPATGVGLDPTYRRDPARRTIRRHDAVFGLVPESVGARGRHRDRLPEAVAIVGVQPLEDDVVLQRL